MLGYAHALYKASTWIRLLDPHFQFFDQFVVLLKEGRFEPRLPGYHFLDFIKEDEAAKKKTNKGSEETDPEVLAANLHGIGRTESANIYQQSIFSVNI